MNPKFRNLVIIMLLGAFAVWSGYAIADGNMLPLAIAVFGALALGSARFQRPVEGLLCAFVLGGYILGNRGFAQLMIIPGVPLFPAEMLLGFCLGLFIIQGAFERRLPWKHDLLNGVIAVWLVLGALRLVLDFPSYGFSALRDSAMVYYAIFFFIGQNLALDKRSLQAVHFALRWSLIPLVPLYLASGAFPDFFFRTLTVHGIPVIFYKGDLVATMLAGGVFYLYQQAGAGRPWLWPGWILTLAGVFVPTARAAMLALFMTFGLQAFARQFRFLFRVALMFVALTTGSLVVELFSGKAYYETRAYRAMEYGASIVDVSGTHDYRSYQPGDLKGNPYDNNRFRLYWWRAAIMEAWHHGPLFGVGFGFDLAARFLQEYGLLGDPNFDARSPHSIIVTTFGRMGFLGLAAFGLVTFGLLRDTLEAARRARQEGKPTEVLALLSFVWVIYVSACFGVVLEGPMGALPFWLIAGLAHARLRKPDETVEAEG